jgi:hypothetical protein
VKTSKLLLTVTLVIILSMVALIWFFPPNGDFQVENPFWNGLSTFDAKIKVTPLNTFTNLPSEPTRTTLFLVPYEQFSASDLQLLQSYVSKGGTLVVLDDYGYGNQVLGGLNVNIKFTGEPLLDPLFDYRNKFLPKITDFTQTSLSTNVSSIVFNHASSLNETSGATVVAYSSEFSFLDLNDNAAWDSNEPTGSMPVAAYVKLGQGYVIAITDPSMLINGMIGLDDNQQFINNIVNLQGSNVQVFVDQTHLPQAPLDDAKAAVATVYGAVASPVGTLSLIAIALALSLNPIWRNGGKLGRKH